MADVRIEQALRLARVWNELGAIELTVTQEHPSVDSAKTVNFFRSTDVDYVETPSGQRHQDVMGRDQAGRAIYHQAAFADGSRFAVLDFRKGEPEVPQNLCIKTSFDNEASRASSARPDPLRYYYVGKIPLHEALPSAIYLGPEEHQERPAHRFLFRDVAWGQQPQQLELHLAENGIIPHQLVFFKTEDDRLSSKPLWSWTATEERMVRGHPFPFKGKNVQYHLKRPGQEGEVTQLTVHKVEFGKSYPASTFWREAENRIGVFDAGRGTITPPKVAPVIPQAVVVHPIRAEEPSGANHLATISLAFGGVVLCVGLFLWLRRG